MIKLSEFSHNHHRPGVKLLAKNIRRGISVIMNLRQQHRVIKYLIAKLKSKSYLHFSLKIRFHSE